MRLFFVMILSAVAFLWSQTSLRAQGGPANTFQAFVTISATDTNATEPGSVGTVDTGMFTIRRTGYTNVALQILCEIIGTALNGLDYTKISNVVVMPAGATSVDIIVNPLDDNLSEGTETVTVRLHEPLCVAIYPPPPECYRVGFPAQATVQIVDDDPPPTNRPPFVHIVGPNNGSIFFAPVNIPIAAGAQDPDANDFVATVEFFAGNLSLGTRTNNPLAGSPINPFILIWSNTPVGDHVLRALATDSHAASAWSPPVNISVRQPPPPPTNLPPIVTIHAPDPVASEGTNCYRWPGWSNSVPVGISGTNTATFVVRRIGSTNDALTVQLHIGGLASNGVDYVELPGVVTIPAGKHAVELKVVPIDDLLPEPLETVILGLRPLTNSPGTVPPYNAGYPSRAAAVIVDNDKPRPTTSVLLDRCFHLVRPGNNGTWWQIDCSTNMVHWTSLCTNQVTDGALHFVDPDADNAPNRFYRAVSAPAPAD